MSRRVRRRVASKGKGNVNCPNIEENLNLDDKWVVDWTRLPDDTVIRLFSSLNYRDRASLSSTCRTWRSLGKSPYLWQVLDLRSHKFDPEAATAVSSLCGNLQKLRFRGAESAEAIIFLRSKTLREISGDCCKKLTDATLSVVVARHELLECLQLGPDFCEMITSAAIKQVAFCCRQLQKLWLSGIHKVDADAINALAMYCPNLTDLGFVDCLRVDETALGNVTSVRFLSVAGTTHISWDSVLQQCSKLPNMICLDVSRTNIAPNIASELFSSLLSLKVLCALNCPLLEEDATFVSRNNRRGKVLLAVFTDIFKGLATLFVDKPKSDANAFLDWRKSQFKDLKLANILNWLEWVISNSLLRISENNPPGLDNFWLNQGTKLLCSFLESSQEEVQEKAATALATFVVIDDENASIDISRTEAVLREGGIRLLLNLARSWQEGLLSEVVKAIANLSVNANVAKAVAAEGGIDILINLARSANRMVAEEAAGGLWNLSVGDEHKGVITKAGGVRALVELIVKWSSSTSGEGVVVYCRKNFFLVHQMNQINCLCSGTGILFCIVHAFTMWCYAFQERAAGALANLAADEKCSIEVASVGGVHALVALAQKCRVEGVQEQAARALANMAAHGDCNGNNAAVGQETGALEALVQLTRSRHDGVRQEAAGALWNLSFDDRNREAIAAAGGIEALVALARTCSNAPRGLQERAAGALWGLSVSEANSIAIGQEGGVVPLIALAQSEVEDVHETAAGALWNLSFTPANALRIIEQGGIPALVHLCSSSTSKMARFMSALSMAYMFDKRLDEIAMAGTSRGSTSKSISLDAARKTALKHIEVFVKSFSDAQSFSAALASSAPVALTQVTESACIQEAGHLRCSGSEIGRFVIMLRNPSPPPLKSCAAFALLQFTFPGGRHASHHASLLQNAGAPRILRAAAAAAGAPLEAKVFARIVLRNLEHHNGDYPA